MIRKKTIPDNSFAGLLIVLLFLLFSCNNPDEEKSVPFPQDFNEKMEWWKDVRFGLFIHWVPVSLITSYELQYQINGEWKTFYEGDTIGERKKYILSRSGNGEDSICHERI